MTWFCPLRLVYGGLNQDPEVQHKKSSDLQTVLVHMSEATTVQVEHPDAAAHSQEVTAAVQSRKVDHNGSESTLHLQDSEDRAFVNVSMNIVMTAINITWIFLF